MADKNEISKTDSQGSVGDLPRRIQIIYGLGVSYAMVDQIFAQWLLYYYLPPAASQLRPVLPPIFISLALVISRFVDMIADPAIGYLSDRTSSKYGRRIPFIAIGTIPLAVLTIAFFFPPRDSSQLIIFTYLTVVGSLFFVFYTIVGAPYNALIPELASNKIERLNLSTWQSVFRLLFTAVAMVLPGWLITLIGAGNDERGVRGMVIILSVLMVVCLFIMVAKIDEKKYSGGKSSQTSIKESFSYIFSNRSLIFYLFGLMFFFLGFNTLRATINYYVEDVMGYGPGIITLASGLLFASAAAFFYPINRLSRKVGYKKPLLVFLIIMILLSLSLTRLGRELPQNAGFIIFFLFGIPVSGAAFIYPPAMLSEIAARFSKKEGTHIEGVFFGLQGFFLKLAFLLSIAFVPLLLVASEDISLLRVLAGEPEEVTRQGIYYTSFLAAGSFLLSFLSYLGYREGLD